MYFDAEYDNERKHRKHLAFRKNAPYLPIVLFNIQHVKRIHLSCKNVGKCPSPLGNSNMEEPGEQAGEKN